MTLRRRLGLSAAALGVGAAAWLPLASVALCAALGTLHEVSPHVLPVAAVFYWRDYGGVPLVARWLQISAAGAGALALMPALAALCWPASDRLKAARKGQRPQTPRRALSDLHGSADWLGLDDLKRLFPGSAPGYGGVVVGEAYRVDRDRVAHLDFDKDDPETWGQGGRAPLLIDPCTTDSGHGAVFAGSGGYKTTAVTISTLLHWIGAAVVLDPSGQVGPMLHRLRASLGHKVVMLGPGLEGFNVLDWIDPRDPLAETYVEAVIEQIAGQTEPTGENAIFKQRGKELLTCLLADLLWSDAPARRKTLREFRKAVLTPENKMRGQLEDIHACSPSQLARDLAGTLKGIVHETFSGIYSNATADTQWLSIEPYAEIVSGDSFRTDELRNGKLTVFVQIPMDTLRARPELARVVIGALLGSVYRAEGAVRGRVLFLLDEVNFLGKLRALEDARDAGRKYGITLVCMWQSLGQLIDTWGRAGKGAWFSSCSWRMFARVKEPETAEEVAKAAGSYTALARTQGTSSSSQSGLSNNSRNSGQNTGLSEQKRDLIRPDEVTAMRADEAILITAGRAARVGRAIYFRRPEMLARVDKDGFTERRRA